MFTQVKDPEFTMTDEDSRKLQWIYDPGPLDFYLKGPPNGGGVFELMKYAINRAFIELGREDNHAGDCYSKSNHSNCSRIFEFELNHTSDTYGCTVLPA